MIQISFQHYIIKFRSLELLFLHFYFLFYFINIYHDEYFKIYMIIKLINDYNHFV
jgi:hypothetical protein